MTDVRVLAGADLEASLDDVARLRIEVFRAWPYLYDGSLDYERRYLEAYRKPGAVVVTATDSGRVVGASTGAPMEQHAEDFAAPFAGRDLAEIFYFAESVLLPDWRGRGIGHRFFDLREAHARALGRRYAAFCSVIRPDDHPMRPVRYRSNDAFWRGRGYAPMPGVVAEFAWKDIGEAAETRKRLQFWMRDLQGE